MDVRIHIPAPIHLVQTPFDLMARGDVTIAVREDGVTTRGALTIDRGTLDLFGHVHRLVDGSLSFTDKHPRGHLALTFERDLSRVMTRDVARRGAASRVTFAGPITKPKVTLGGVTSSLAEVMATLNAGRPLASPDPSRPASATVQTLRGDQLFVLTFMAANLPHLLFLDRIDAWADPYQSPSAYGRIENVEAESRTGNARVRAVARPPTPGRSSAELQYDRFLFEDDRTAVGVGVRGGSRGGGGVGVFVEWSSED
jgi:hypothetical protein